MHLQTLQFIAHIQNITGGKFKDKKNSNEENANSNWTVLFFSPQKVRYFALKNQALCLCRSQRNVN